ncbi:MAG: alkaline phosphatase, partial [Bacteroidota bacterium]
MTLRNVFLIAIIMILFASCNPQLQNLQSDQPPKNIILLIGDGMGLAQVSSSFYFQDKKPSFTRFKHIGLLNTSSDAQKVTDSASSATAYATGKRTYNGAIGVDMDT